jgi:hypothetical protein
MYENYWITLIVGGVFNVINKIVLFYFYVVFFLIVFVL